MRFAQFPKLYGLKHNVGSYYIYVHGAGDVDGDGFDDIPLLATTRMPQVPGDDPQTSRLCVFFGRSEFPQVMTLDEELLNGGACGILPEGGVPRSIYGIGDVNGDRYTDIATYFGEWHNAAAGRIGVIYGRNRGALCGARSPQFDVVFTTSAVYNGYIMVIAGMRDFNADGYDDILLCDRHYPADGDSPPSRAICIFGGDLEKKAGPLSNLKDCMEFVNAGIFEGHEEYVQYPVRFDFAGDVNGDGYEDLAVYDRGQAYVYFNPLGAVKGAFVRGDSNQDSRIDIADAIRILSYLFGGAAALPCMDAGDANDDETMNIADAIRILGFLFGSGVKPPLPPPNQCGPDPQGDTLGCAERACR